MMMVGRSWSGGSEYRYGFDGMENEDEIAGNNNALDFGARMYDARLGRWLSVDPLFAKYSSFSPYSFVINSPIYFVDLDGRDIKGGFSVVNRSGEPIIIVGNGLIISYTMQGKTLRDYDYKYSHNSISGGPLNTSFILENNQRFKAIVHETKIFTADGSIATTKTFSGEIWDVSNPDKPYLVGTTEVFDIDGIDLTSGQSVNNEDGILFYESDIDMTKSQDDDMVKFDNNDDNKWDGNIDVKFHSPKNNAVNGVLGREPSIENDSKVIISSENGGLVFDVRTKTGVGIKGKIEEAGESPTIAYPTLKED